MLERFTRSSTFWSARRCTASASSMAAPDKPTYIELGFRAGDVVSVDGQAMSPASVMIHLARP